MFSSLRRPSDSSRRRVAWHVVTDADDEPTTEHPQQVGVEPVDLDMIERDLAAVETALQRLSDGTYWSDEVTGEPIAEYILAADPTARRA